MDYLCYMKTNQNRIGDTFIGKDGMYTLAEVLNLLNQVQIFSSNNNGLSSVAGKDNNERCQVMLNSYITSINTKVAIDKYTVPLNEYIS